MPIYARPDRGWHWLACFIQKARGMYQQNSCMRKRWQPMYRCRSQPSIIPCISSRRQVFCWLSLLIPPKPILEVYPTVSGLSCSGYIRLLLLVNKNGVAESIEIIENTTQLDTCLTLAVEAARKSRWIPAKVEKKAGDTWVTKTYKFNVKR